MSVCPSCGASMALLGNEPHRGCDACGGVLTLSEAVVLAYPKPYVFAGLPKSPGEREIEDERLILEGWQELVESVEWLKANVNWEFS